VICHLETSRINGVRLKENEEELHRVINVLKFKRYSISPAEVTHETETKLEALYIEKYFDALQKVGIGLASTELQPADDLAFLATNSIISLWKLTADDGYLCTAAALLEYVLTRSQQSFLARLLLVRIYRLLGMSIYHGLRVQFTDPDRCAGSGIGTLSYPTP